MGPRGPEAPGTVPGPSPPDLSAETFIPSGASLEGGPSVFVWVFPKAPPVGGAPARRAAPPSASLTRPAERAHGAFVASAVNIRGSTKEPVGHICIRHLSKETRRGPRGPAHSSAAGKKCQVPIRSALAPFSGAPPLHRFSPSSLTLHASPVSNAAFPFQTRRSPPRQRLAPPPPLTDAVSCRTALCSPVPQLCWRLSAEGQVNREG